MKSFCKELVPLFAATLLICCAGSNSSSEKNNEPKRQALIKAGTPAADSLEVKLPTFAQTTFKKTFDSIPGEYYYFVQNNQIDSLFKLESGTYKPIASIAYDSLDGQDNYNLKMGKTFYSVKDGNLSYSFEGEMVADKTGELEPKKGISKKYNLNGNPETEVRYSDVDKIELVRTYYDNGQIEFEKKGTITRDNRDFVLLTGEQKQFNESGLLVAQFILKSDSSFTRKEWNDKGTLIKDIDFPKTFKEYWDNGSLKMDMKGKLAWGNLGAVVVDSGIVNAYFESGKLYIHEVHKSKFEFIATSWNESGNIIKEIDYPHHIKEYWDNGKIKTTATGILYMDSNGNFQTDSGRSELYFESGKLQQQNDWKNKTAIASKQWNEEGILVIDLEFPKYIKEYWDNGNLKAKMEGELYTNDNGNFSLINGLREIYFENGKINEISEWKDKAPITCKIWNKNGILKTDYNINKEYKTYWDNGNLETKATGLLYKNSENNYKVDTGISEIYYENGKKNEQNEWKNKHLISHKIWNEKGKLINESYGDSLGQLIFEKSWNDNGILIKDFRFPTYFHEFYDNGKPKTSLTGTLYLDDNNLFQVDSGTSTFFYENGKMNEQNVWKNKSPILHKKWNATGTLVTEFDSSKEYKSYWDNGTLKEIKKGILYVDDQKHLQLDSGLSEKYYESGKIFEQCYWKNKQYIACKNWDENGILKMEVDFPKKMKKYWDNGKLKNEATGILYKGGQDVILLDSGLHVSYSESGKKITQTHWKNKQAVASKEWNEIGILTFDFSFPKYMKSYSHSGDLEVEVVGTLFYNDQGDIKIQDGFRKEYHENKKIGLHQIYKNKKLISKKEWSEDGTLLLVAEMPNSYKEYYENGKIKQEVTGKLVEEDGSFKIKEGIFKEYDQNGNIIDSATFKNFHRISD